MKRIVALILSMLALAGAISAQQYWEGTALVASYGRFPSDGAYAASNSFSSNSVVEVTNLETGESTRVVVVDRLNTPGVFMVLSEDAAQSIDAESGSPFRVRVALPQDGDAAPSISSADQPFHPDPDINPAAERQAEQPTPEEQAAPEEQPTPGEPAEAEAEEPTAQEPAEEAPAAEEEPAEEAPPEEEPAEPEAEEPPAEEPAADEAPSEAAPSEEPSPGITHGIGEGLSESGGILTGRTPADDLPGIAAEEPEAEREPATEEEPGEPEAEVAAEEEPSAPVEPDAPAEQPQPAAEGDPLVAERAPEALLAEPALTVPQRPEAAEPPEVATAPQPEPEQATEPAGPQAAQGIANGALGLGNETRHTSRIARPTEPGTIFSFRPAPAEAPDRGGAIASGTSTGSQSLEGVGSGAGTRAQSADREPSLRVSDLGPRNAPEPGSPEISTAPAIRTPAAEALGRQPGREESVAAASELPGAKEPTAPESTMAEEAEEPTDEVAAEEAALEEADEGLSRQPIPEDAIVALEPSEHRSPQYATPETSTATRSEAPDEGDPEEVATPEESAAAESPVGAGSSSGPAAPEHTPPVDAPVAESSEPEGGDEQAISEQADEEQAEEEPETEEGEAESAPAPDEPVEPSVTDEIAAAELPIVRQLESSSYYLQLGVFSRPASAQRAMRQLGERFPFAVYPTESEDSTLYKVLVGPLNEDEKGAVLYWVRANGYGDAFLRRGDSYEAAAGSSEGSSSVSSR